MFNKQPIFLSVLMLCAQPLFWSPVDAAIFKCVDDKGKTFYNDKSCPKTDAETQLKAIKDPIGGYIPNDTLVNDDSLKKNKKLIIGDSLEAANGKRAIGDDTKNGVIDSDDKNGRSDSSENGRSSSSDNDLVEGTNNDNQSERSLNSESGLNKDKQKTPFKRLELKSISSITLEPLSRSE